MNDDLFWVKIIDEIDPEIFENAAEDVDARPGRAHRRSRVSKIFGRAAVIAAAAVLVLFSVLMFNTKVRAAVLDFFIWWDDKGYARVHFGAEDAEDGSVDVDDVSFGYIPEGFVLHEISNDTEQSDPIFRRLRIILAENRYLPEILLSKSPDDSVFIKICKSTDYHLGYAPESFDMVRISTINGKAAFIYYKYPVSNIIFGDEKITVDMNGIGIELEEIVKIAENMTW